jgi:hypothetical protein
MKLSRRQLRRLIIEQDELPSDSYKISSDVRMDDKTGSKKGKMRSKQSSDSTYSDKMQSTNLRTGETGKMTDLIGYNKKQKSFGKLTMGPKTVQYKISMDEREGGEYDGQYYYNMYIGKDSKLKKADVVLRLNNNSKNPKDGKITYEVGKHPNLKKASALKAILKLKLMGVDAKEVINIMKNLHADADVDELHDAMKKAVNHKAEDYKEMKEGKMKLSRKQLRKLIIEVVNEGFGIDTAAKTRELGRSSYEAAQKDSEKNGKSYFVKDDLEVVTFTNGDPNVDPNMTQKDAYDANDGTVHYKGSI